MSTEEAGKVESAPTSKEDSKPTSQAVSAKQKQAVVSDVEIYVARQLIIIPPAHRKLNLSSWMVLVAFNEMCMVN